jgi:hypothetical protein
LAACALREASVPPACRPLIDTLRQLDRAVALHDLDGALRVLVVFRIHDDDRSAATQTFRMRGCTLV